MGLRDRLARPDADARDRRSRDGDAASARVLPGADDGARDCRGAAAFATVRPDARSRARRLLRDIGLDLDEPFVVFAPGAAYGRAKQWLPERFAELADLIINERGWSVVMVGSNADRSACDGHRAPAAADRHADQPADRFLRQERSADAGRRAVAGARGGVERFRRDAPGRRGRHEGGRGLRRRPTRRARRRSRQAPTRRAPVVVTHEVFCRPCMLRECPIDHRCMSGISRADSVRGD